MPAPRSAVTDSTLVIVLPDTTVSAAPTNVTFRVLLPAVPATATRSVPLRHRCVGSARSSHDVERVVSASSGDQIVARIAGDDVVEFVAGAVDRRISGQRQVFDIGPKGEADRGLYRVGALEVLFAYRVGGAVDDVDVVASRTPPAMESFPVTAVQASLPAPPLRVSFPAPPFSTSSPSSPFRLSLPAASVEQVGEGRSVQRVVA